MKVTRIYLRVRTEEQDLSRQDAIALTALCLASRKASLSVALRRGARAECS